MTAWFPDRARRPRVCAPWALAASVSLALPTSAARAADPPDLDVRVVHPAEATGTMHFAERITLRVGSARPLVLDENWPGLLPIPGPHLPLAGGRFVLLGWSSTGAGMQTLHALSVAVRDGAVTLTGHLTLTTDRPSSTWVVRRTPAGVLRVGIAEPEAIVHDPDGWSLRTGAAEGGSFGLEDLRDLAFEDVTPEPGDLVYAPPFQRRPHPGRVAWAEVAGAGTFVLPSRDEGPRGVLRRLYAAHRPWDGQDVINRGDALDEAALLRSFDAPLVERWRADEQCKARRGGTGRLDFDPLLDAQDFDDGGLEALTIACETSPPTARCRATFRVFAGDPASSRRITYQFAQRPVGWRIVDVRWGDRRPTLREMLDGPCQP